MKKNYLKLFLFLMTLTAFSQTETLPIPEGLEEHYITYDRNDIPYLVGITYINDNEEYIIKKYVNNFWVDLKSAQLTHLGSKHNFQASHIHEIVLNFDNENNPYISYSPGCICERGDDPIYIFVFLNNKWEFVLSHTHYNYFFNTYSEEFNDANEFITVSTPISNGEEPTYTNHGTFFKMLTNRNYSDNWLYLNMSESLRNLYIESDNPSSSYLIDEVLSEYYNSNNLSKDDYNELSVLSVNYDPVDNTPILSIELNNFTEGKIYIVLAYKNKQFRYLGTLNSDVIDLENHYFYETTFTDDKKIISTFKNDFTGNPETIILGNYRTLLSTKETVIPNLKLSVLNNKIISNLANITIKIYNNLGAKIKNENLSSTIYIVRASDSKGNTQNFKFIIQ